MPQEGSYYSRRSARDPDWRERQIQDAMERDRRRRESDPETFLASNRETCARYRERIRADPERLAAVRARRAKLERERRRRLTVEERAEASRAASERKRRSRALARHGLTFQELHERVPDFGERSSLRVVLADELRSGRVLLIGDCYVLNGKLPADVKRALLDLDRVDDRR